jgi:hypothetical protein
MDILQLSSRLASSAKCSIILAQYPEWNGAPWRLKLPTLAKDSSLVTVNYDHSYALEGRRKSHKCESEELLEGSALRVGGNARTCFEEMAVEGWDVLKPFGQFIRHDKLVLAEGDGEEDKAPNGKWKPKQRE